jgi:outer membrane protein OmpU
MYKSLLLSTALVAFSGAAFADGVKFDGSANMGMKDEGAGWYMDTDFDLNVKAGAEADNGLSFGIAADLDGDSTKKDDEGFSMFVSGDFGKITGGHGIKGALGHTLADSTKTGNAGSFAQFEQTHLGADFASEAAARYDYSRDAFTISVSTATPAVDGMDDNYAFAGSYGLKAGGFDMTVAAGVEKGATDKTGVTVKADLAEGFVASAGYTKLDSGIAEATHLAAGIGYEMGALSTHANFGRYSADGAEDTTGFGISAAYDLGGGAAAKLAYAVSDDGVNPKTDKMSVGVGFKF